MNRTYNKRRLALVLKLAIALTCASALASCGNAKNPTKNPSPVVQKLQANSAAYQNAGKVNPATGQAATSGTGNQITGVVWLSDCFANSSIGSDPSGPTVNSYQEAYMFMGTAWFAEYEFWDDSACVGNSLQPSTFPNAFSAGYITNMPNTIAINAPGTLNLVAWDSTTSLGYTATNAWDSPLGVNVSFAYTLKTLPANVQSNFSDANLNGSNGDLVVSDIVLKGASTVELAVYSGN